MPGIYLRHGDSYVAMTETAYDQESVLQALIAQHSELLTDEAAGQGPLLFIRREAGVVDREDGAGRWSLDHLYIDAEGVPTLVEVKRSSDSRARREVVAQMLDYAANAKLSFTVARMAAWLEEDARARGTTATALLTATLGVEDADTFWELVATNLEAERFRLIFISDVISPELQRIIEFLNGQMSRTDVLAIEVKQYVDERGEHQTIVPRVIGNTEKAKATKRVRRTTSSDLLCETLQNDELVAAKALLAWADAHPRLTVRWTRAADIGVAGAGDGTLLRIWDERGTLELKVHRLRHGRLGWDDGRIERLLERLDKIDGVAFSGNRRQWPRTALAPLADVTARQQLLLVIEEIIEEIADAYGLP